MIPFIHLSTTPQGRGRFMHTSSSFLILNGFNPSSPPPSQRHPITTHRRRLTRHIRHTRSKKRSPALPPSSTLPSLYHQQPPQKVTSHRHSFVTATAVSEECSLCPVAARSPLPHDGWGLHRLPGPPPSARVCYCKSDGGNCPISLFSHLSWRSHLYSIY